MLKLKNIVVCKAISDKSEFQAISNQLYIEISKNKLNNSLFTVILDLPKAFGSVNYQILLNILEHYRIRGGLRNLLHLYLSNRFFFIDSSNRF